MPGAPPFFVCTPGTRLAFNILLWGSLRLPPRSLLWGSLMIPPLVQLSIQFDSTTFHLKFIVHINVSPINSGHTKPRSVEDQVHYFDSKFRSLVNKAYQEVNGRTKPSDSLPVLHAYLCQTVLSTEALSRIIWPTFHHLQRL